MITHPAVLAVVLVALVVAILQLEKYPAFAFHPKVHDMGAVYCGIAGMLNLLVMFDLLLRVTGSQRQDPAAARRNKRATLAAQSAPAAQSQVQPPQSGGAAG